MQYVISDTFGNFLCHDCDGTTAFIGGIYRMTIYKTVALARIAMDTASNKIDLGKFDVCELNISPV